MEDTLPLGKQTLPPFAHARFCVEYGHQCTSRGDSRSASEKRQGGLKALKSINRFVNGRIQSRADQVDRGFKDKWQIPNSHGDCEDFALLKRKLLLERGWPSGALRIATAVTTDGVGHAVLVVTHQGQDLVLDNLSKDIKHWSETSHKYVKVQSRHNPNEWFNVALGPQALS